MAPLDYSNYLSDKGKMAIPDGSELTIVLQLKISRIRRLIHRLCCSSRSIPFGETVQGLFRTSSSWASLYYTAWELGLSFVLPPS